MKEDSSPSTTSEEKEDHHPANMYQHEQDTNGGGGSKGQQMYDERMGSNSEGKLHRTDEEQVGRYPAPNSYFAKRKRSIGFFVHRPPNVKVGIG